MASTHPSPGHLFALVDWTLARAGGQVNRQNDLDLSTSTLYTSYMMNKEQQQVLEFLKSISIDTTVYDDVSFRCLFDDSKVIDFDFYCSTDVDKRLVKEDRVCLTFEEIENDCESQTTCSLSEVTLEYINKFLVNIKSIESV